MYPSFRLALAIAPLALAITGAAQTSLSVYTDTLQNGFQDWSWATRNLNNSSPVHSGSRSISVTSAYWQGVSFWHSSMDTGPYGSFTFWAHGGSAGGQRLQVYAEWGTNASPVAYPLPALTANSWQQFSVPLSAIGVSNIPNFNRINLQLLNSGTSGTYYLDDVQFAPNPIPALVKVQVDTRKVLQVAEERHFGVNLAIWDSYYDAPYHTTTASLLQEMGTTVVRMPGGSLSDEYHFSSNTTWTNTWPWQASFPDFMRVYTNAGVQGFVTVNYGSGSPQEAAAWVAYANGDPSIYGTAGDITLGIDSYGRDWKTAGYWARLRSQTAAQNTDNKYDFLAIGRAAPFGIKYWEIGNECYGTWEHDDNNLPHHAYTYALRATNYVARMKSVDPAIRIGLVAVPGESEYNNNYKDHPARNPRTGQTNYGWTPVLLTTLRDIGGTPDFIVHHVYPQWTNPDNPSSSPDNDPGLLQSTGTWAIDAATLRQHLTDYLGAAGTNVQLVCTENNSDSGAQGRQSTSLVNGLYYADSLGKLLETEFRGFAWWDLRNGTDRSGYFGSNLYGWRDYGDLGMINGPSTRHPSFYAAKLMQWFARPGDRILQAASDYALVSAHAARRGDGSVTVLLINKSLTADLNAQIEWPGFVADTNCTVRFYGIPNDEAARTNAPAAAQDVTSWAAANTGTNFAASFPRLSISLITLNPAPPPILSLIAWQVDQVTLRIKGQPGATYVLQSSLDLKSWNGVSTNQLTSSELDVTNNTLGAQQGFWRAATLQ